MEKQIEIWASPCHSSTVAFVKLNMKELGYLNKIQSVYL